METHNIHDTYFSGITKDYVARNDALSPFYSYPFSVKGIGEAMVNRSYAPENRNILVQVLQEQHASLGKIQAAVKDNIQALNDENTFTVTTGHQICLLTGPLYFIYKIASAVKLTQELQMKFPEKRFVPVYWAATEDHDFEEIRSVFINGSSYSWQPIGAVSGATGRISTEGIETFFDEMKLAEGEKLTFNKIYRLLKKAWTESPNLSLAIRKAVHDLFGHLGVVSIDADDVRLKRMALPWLEKELKTGFAYKEVKYTSEQLLESKYKPQIEPREINLFYLKDNLRERIIYENGRWFVNNTDFFFSENELENELHTYPERFSPNVVLRPLYQETILPNLAYVGGAAEIAYWLQLKSVFDSAGIDYPVLVPRDGFMFCLRKDWERIQKLGFEINAMLLKPHINVRAYVERTQGSTLSVENELTELRAVFDGLKKRYENCDNGAVKSFSASEAKLAKELEKLEKKAKRCAAKKETEVANFMQNTHNRWFPGGTLSERKNSIIEFWGILGDQPMDKLVELAEPLRSGMKVIVY